MMERSFKNKKILITGIAGFGGSWLAETLLNNEKNIEIFGLKRSTTSLKNIGHILNKLNLFDADITDASAVTKIVKKIDPHIVFHLAAIASSVKARENPGLAVATNVDGTKNLLNALTKSATRLQLFHFASSSVVYKKTEKATPIKETHPIDPQDPYAKSKAVAEKICNEFSQENEIPVIITRAFNQGGPRCREDMVANKIAKLVANAKKEGQKEFAFGNINAIRDFADIRDIVIGYWLAAKKGNVAGIYNLCSGKGIKIKDMIDMALEYVGMKNKVKIIVDRELFRKGEPDVIVGDNTKAWRELGWKPKIPFEQTLKKMIDYYLSTS